MPEQTFTTEPYLPADGREFLTYMQVVMKSMDRLRADGRIPDDPGMDTLLAFWNNVTTQVKKDVDRAGPASQLPIRTSLPMTAVEHQRTWALFDTLYPLLEILEMREVIDLKRTDSVTRVIDALYEGSLT
jgi:hypothetical protein